MYTIHKFQAAICIFHLYHCFRMSFNCMSGLCSYPAQSSRMNSLLSTPISVFTAFVFYLTTVLLLKTDSCEGKMCVWVLFGSKWLWRKERKQTKKLRWPTRILFCAVPQHILVTRRLNRVDCQWLPKRHIWWFPKQHDCWHVPVIFRIRMWLGFK